MFGRAAAALALLGVAAPAASGMIVASLRDDVERPLPALLGGKPAILMFWRADCLPCLLELQALDQFRWAAGAVRIIPIGLQSTSVLTDKLHAMKLSVGISWRTPDDAAAVLTTYGGAPPRLPLSVLVKADGRVCARRVGLVGPRLIREWVRQCT